MPDPWSYAYTGGSHGFVQRGALMAFVYMTYYLLHSYLSILSSHNISAFAKEYLICSVCTDRTDHTDRTDRTDRTFARIARITQTTDTL